MLTAQPAFSSSLSLLSLSIRRCLIIIVIIDTAEKSMIVKWWWLQRQKFIVSWESSGAHRSASELVHSSSLVQILEHTHCVLHSPPFFCKFLCKNLVHFCDSPYNFYSWLEQLSPVFHQLAYLHIVTSWTLIFTSCEVVLVAVFVSFLYLYFCPILCLYLLLCPILCSAEY